MGRAFPEVQQVTPHVAGRSPNAQRAAIEAVMANLDAHFAGEPPVTPVPPDQEPAR